MPRTKLLLLFMIAALAALAMRATAGAGTALAAPAECTSAPQSSWCFAITSLNTSLLLTEESSFLSDKVPNSKSIWEVPQISGEHVECGQASGEGRLLTEEPQVAGLTIEFAVNCHVVGNETNCEVLQPILTDDLEGILTLVDATGEITLEPERTNWWTTIKIKPKSPNECEQEGELVVRGKQKCLTPHLEEDKTEHILKCESSGSELRVGTKELKIELEEILFLGGAENTSWVFFQSLN